MRCVFIAQALCCTCTKQWHLHLQSSSKCTTTKLPFTVEQPGHNCNNPIYYHSFVVILGIDFLRKHQLVLDFTSIPIGVQSRSTKEEVCQAPELEPIWKASQKCGPRPVQLCPLGSCHSFTSPLHRPMSCNVSHATLVFPSRGIQGFIPYSTWPNGYS